MYPTLVEKTYQLICKKINSDEECTRLCVKGMCRYWTRQVLQTLDQLKHELPLEIRYEAREVKISPNLYHTFMRLIIMYGEKQYAYLLDGVGVIKYETYFGPEETCPDHLKNSRLDLMNAYRPN